MAKRVHGDLDLENDAGEFEVVEPTPKPQAPVDEDRRDECEFSKECIISVSGAELPYRQIRCCRVQESPQSCPPKSWKDMYRSCPIRLKNLGILGFYRSLGAQERHTPVKALPFGGHV
jgi:hypothetical protein